MNARLAFWIVFAASGAAAVLFAHDPVRGESVAEERPGSRDGGIRGRGAADHA